MIFEKETSFEKCNKSGLSECRILENVRYNIFSKSFSSTTFLWDGLVSSRIALNIIWSTRLTKGLFCPESFVIDRVKIIEWVGESTNLMIVKWFFQIVRIISICYNPFFSLTQSM